MVEKLRYKCNVNTVISGMGFFFHRHLFFFLI